MKKRLKVITAFLLMIVMAASGTCVFAGTDVQPAGDEPQSGLDIVGEGEAVDEALPEEELPGEEVLPEEVVPEEVVSEETPAPEEGTSDIEAKSEPVAGVAAEDEEGSVELMSLPYISTTLTATTMHYSTSKKPAWTTCPSVYTSTSGDVIVAAIKVNSSGKLWIDAQRLDSNSSSAVVYVGKYDASTDKMLEYNYEKTGYLYAGDDPELGIGGLDVVKGGTYYIVVRQEYSSRWVQLNVRPYLYSYSTRTVTPGKLVLASGYKTNYNDSGAQFKIKPTKTGYIRVSLKEYGYSPSSGYVTLRNSKKKTVSDKLYFSNGKYPSSVQFGVKKGVTYYLKVNNCVGSSDYQYKYGISYKIYAAKLRANTSKKKATTLKRKAKYISTAMPATGKSGSQWYKFKVTKKRATRINIDTSNIKYSNYKSVKLTVTVYCGKKKVGTTSLINGKVNPIEITYSTTYGKAKKGTYYIKITKSAKANGAYRIRYAK